MTDLKSYEAAVLGILSSALSSSTGSLQKQVDLSGAQLSVDDIVGKLEADGFVFVTPNPITDEKHLSPTSSGLAWYRNEGFKLDPHRRSSDVSSGIFPSSTR